ncbi:DNA ligase [Phytophthora cinnamomi]|uniref:DNA ligase n=1 Tax=Phytophthora cinnamomi TaxID=4785 RepID=UPI00355AA381|nr:DNA ligase [Phytophthora cinnamomi]
MVRKASRLAPGRQSVEEVLLNRLATGEGEASATRSSPALPPGGLRRRSQTGAAPRTTGSDKRLLGGNRAAAPVSTAPAAASTAAAGASTPMSLEFMLQMSSEIANLDQRLQRLHSKIHLLRSLEDQKRMCLGLEANAELYRDNIAALKGSIVQLEDKLMDKQQELAQLHETTQATRFGIHKAEQSIARVQGMLEAVRVVHPGTVERIEAMFRDNPLLSKDLKDVITLHANKRRELLSKIELDRTELEVQTASKGAGTQEDQMLLHRVKWVLSRIDLGMHDQSANNQQDTRVMHGNRVGTMNQLCALFEFIRNGDTAPLAPENNPEHREQDQPSRSAASTQHNTNNHSDCIVRRTDVMDGSNTWHSFLQSLVIKFVPENLLSVKERLVRRAAEMDAEVAEIKANPQQHHLYR